MNKVAEQLLDAHVNFVLSELTGDRLKEIIADEAGFIWDQFDKVKLNEVVTKEEILDFQKRNFDHRDKVADPVKEYTKSLRDAIIDHLKDSKVQLKDVIEKDDYEEFINEIAKLKEIREELIHAAVSNPLYGEVIANSLTNGIKSFTSEEGLAGKLPGASSFFKLGGGLLSGLQDGIDKNVNKFIRENIQKLTGQSEKFVKSMIDERKVKEMGAKVWNKANERNLGAIMRKVDVEQFEGFEPIIESIANKALRSDFAKEMNEFVIDHFLTENGNKTIQTILKDIEITKEDVLRESDDFFVKAISRSIEDGTLEERVRLYLGNFYSSDIVKGILG